MIAKITPDGLYRVTYGETPGLTWEEMEKRQPWKFETLLPGHPKPEEYKLESMATYKMHQRCAPSFRVGKILLAADAAHLCNP
jgi:2-polyprenyl-6-methoxyphenol hydroxylase-like FAD-dependent oxidoreductase